MNIVTLFRLFFSPTQGWKDLIGSNPSVHRLYLLHVIPFSFIPPLMIFLSSHNHSDVLANFLTSNRILLVVVAFFLVQLIVVPIMAMVVRQLAEVADAHPSFKEAFILSAVAPTPLWLSPIFLLIPNALLNIGVTALAMMASAGFIFYGIPVVFRINEKGHALLLFGAVLMAGVIAWGFLMVCTLMIWGSIQNYQFAGLTLS